jgi:hypothetical protein
MSTHASKLDKHRDQGQNIILPKTSKHTSELDIDYLSLREIHLRLFGVRNQISDSLFL